MRRREGVDGQQAEARLAVDEDDVVVIHDGLEHTGEDVLTRDFVDEVHLGSAQVDVRGDEVQVLRRGGLHGLARVFLTPE